MRELVYTHLVSKFVEMTAFLILVTQVYRPRYGLHIRFFLDFLRWTDMFERSLVLLELLDDDLLHIVCGLSSILLNGEPVVKVIRVPFSVLISLFAA